MYGIMSLFCIKMLISNCGLLFFQVVNEQSQGSDSAVPIICSRSSSDEMTISDDCRLQDDQRDGSSNVLQSTAAENEAVNIKEGEDVPGGQLSRHLYNLGCDDLFRCLYDAEKVQGEEVAECCKYSGNIRDKMISKPYVCDVCNKAFTRPNHLNIHKRTHTGETPYVCDVCSKAFSQLSILNRHKLTHTGVKPFVCYVCNKAFSRLCHLDRHVRTHTGETPYVCHVCNKSFNRQSTLNVHQHTHTGDRPYVCHVCKKAFKWPGNLHSHKRIHAAANSNSDPMDGNSSNL